MKLSIFISILCLTTILSCDAEKLFKKAPVIDDVILSKTQANPFDTIRAEVKATNPEDGALSYQWSVSPNSGPIIDPVDSRVIRWIAPTTGGQYTFHVEVSNDYKSADKQKSLRVNDITVPIVRILSPAAGDYWIQTVPVKIECEAYHSNGIKKVEFYINGHMKAEKSGSASDNYAFNFTPDTATVGGTWVRIEAVAANALQTRGADSVRVQVEGIIPGK